MALLVNGEEAALKHRAHGPRGKASPWAGLHSRFLDSLDPGKQVHIFDLSARMAQKLHRWAARYPLIRRVRVWPLALSVAAAAPVSGVEALISTARVSLWVFTLDDLFDEERVTQAELMRRAERYCAIAHNQLPPASGDSLAAALAEVRDDLAQYPLFGDLGHEWATALCGTIEGMVREYQWRLQYQREGTTALPSYEDYLANGLYSIGGPPHVWASLITTDDPSTLKHVERLRAMEQIASSCIRLANDLQSYTKEMSEGKFNALVLLSSILEQQGVGSKEAHEQAQARVRADIAEGLDRLGDLQARSATRTGRPEAAIADIARFVCDFYREHDYHTFVAQS